MLRTDGGRDGGPPALAPPGTGGGPLRLLIGDNPAGKGGGAVRVADALDAVGDDGTLGG